MMCSCGTRFPLKKSVRTSSLTFIILNLLCTHVMFDKCPVFNHTFVIFERDLLFVQSVWLVYITSLIVLRWCFFFIIIIILIFAWEEWKNKQELKKGKERSSKARGCFAPSIFSVVIVYPVTPFELIVTQWRSPRPYFIFLRVVKFFTWWDFHFYWVFVFTAQALSLYKEERKNIFSFICVFLGLPIIILSPFKKWIYICF